MNLNETMSNMKLGHFGSTTRSLVQILENLVYTLEGIVLIQYGENTSNTFFSRINE